MPSAEVAILIDAQQYLDLYRVAKGKKLLAPLQEQASYIFVTRQIKDEVQRRKVEVCGGIPYVSSLSVSSFAASRCPIICLTFLPARQEPFANKLKRHIPGVEELNKILVTAAEETLEKISRSEDEVSKALASLFAKAIEHTSREMTNARDRRGNGVTHLARRVIPLVIKSVGSNSSIIAKARRRCG